MLRSMKKVLFLRVVIIWYFFDKTYSKTALFKFNYPIKWSRTGKIVPKTISVCDISTVFIATPIIRLTTIPFTSGIIDPCCITRCTITWCHITNSICQVIIPRCSTIVPYPCVFSIYIISSDPYSISVCPVKFKS